MFPHGTSIIGPYGDMSCVDLCAYHGTIRLISGYGEAYYIVMSDFQAGSGCGLCGPAPTTEQNFTSALSHEVYETITDAEVGIDALAWYDPNYGIVGAEIADICNMQQGTLTGSSGHVWTMQKFFSNSRKETAF